MEHVTSLCWCLISGAMHDAPHVLVSLYVVWCSTRYPYIKTNRYEQSEYLIKRNKKTLIKGRLSSI